METNTTPEQTQQRVQSGRKGRKKVEKKSHTIRKIKCSICKCR